jgi:hypothetical protein
LTECFATSFWLGTPCLETRLRDLGKERQVDLRHFITLLLLGRGVIIAIRRKGTLQRKEKTVDLPCN